MVEPASVVIARRVEWSDTDASGAWHNTAAFRWIEAAETSLLNGLGFIDDVYGRHPRVHIDVDFLAPLRFRDRVLVELRVAAVGTTSVTYEAEIRRGDTVCLRGRLVAVLVDQMGGTPEPWPAEYRRRLETGGRQPAERASRPEGEP